MGDKVWVLTLKVNCKKKFFLNKNRQLFCHQKMGLLGVAKISSLGQAYGKYLKQRRRTVFYRAKWGIGTAIKNEASSGVKFLLEVYFYWLSCDCLLLAGLSGEEEAFLPPVWNVKSYP